MRQIGAIITTIGLLVFIGLFGSCAGPQPSPGKTPPAIEEATLPPGSAAPPPEKTLQSPNTAAGAESGIAAQPRSDQIKFMYEDVYFKRGRTDLDPAAKMLLDKKAQWLQANPHVKVVIEGHTDFKGSKEYNLALGDRRSGAVKSYLIRLGIARERLMAISYGREKPAVAGKTEEDRARNRRVHFVIEAK